jgi:hypothetical protein
MTVREEAIDLVCDALLYAKRHMTNYEFAVMLVDGILGLQGERSPNSVAAEVVRASRNPLSEEDRGALHNT